MIDDCATNEEPGRWFSSTQSCQVWSVYVVHCAVNAPVSSKYIFFEQFEDRHYIRTLHSLTSQPNNANPPSCRAMHLISYDSLQQLIFTAATLKES